MMRQVRLSDAQIESIKTVLRWRLAKLQKQIDGIETMTPENKQRHEEIAQEMRDLAEAFCAVSV